MLGEEDKIVRWELPLHKIIPKKLFEAQQSEVSMLPDAQLIAAAMPDSIDWRLRIRYNSLLEKFKDPTHPKDRGITMEEIYDQICTYETFKRRTDIPAKALFITRKIGTYVDDQDALLTAFTVRMWEVASAPLMKPNGQLDIEATKLVHKTIQILLDRKFGQAVQRQISVGVQNPATMDPIAIENQLRILEAANDK